MINALETAVENYFIELFRAHPALRGKQFRNSDSQQDSKSDQITVEAVQGEDLQEGPRGLNGKLRSAVEVTVTYRSTLGPRQNDIVKNALMDAINGAGSTPTKAQRVFGHLLIFMERMSGDQSRTKNLRLRSLTIPIEAGMP